MKNKNHRVAAASRGSLAELIFALLPLVALTPNFFLIPALTYPGLATQEAVLALAVLACAALSLTKALQLTPQFRVDRQLFCLFVTLLVFLLWQVVSLAWAPDWGEGVRIAGLWFGLLVFFVTAVWAVRERSAWWVFAMLVVATSLLLWSIFYEYTKYGPYEMAGIFFNHGITAELLAMMLPLFLLVFLCERKRRAAVLIALLAAGVSAGALMLTLRRGPLLGLSLAGSVITLALLTKTVEVADRRRLFLVVGVVLLVILPLVIYKREALLERLRSATQLKTAENVQAAELGLTGRVVVWLTALEMGKHNALKGVGVGGYMSCYGPYRKFFLQNPSYAPAAAAAEAEDHDEIKSPQAHSEYLQLFAELGAVGVLLFLAFWLQVVWQLWQRRRATNGYLAFGALCGLLVFTASSAVGAFSFRSSPDILILSCLLAIGFAVKRPAEAEAAQASLPKPLLVGLSIVALLASLALLGRNYNVYASQQAQGSQRIQDQLDFKIALDSEAENERLVRRYQRVLNLDPANVGAHLGYSVLLFQMKRVPESVQHAEYAFQHGYNRPYGYLLRAFGYEQLGDLNKATQILQDCLASFPKSMATRAAYAELLRKQGRYEEAKRQRALLEKVDARRARSWDLALRMKDAAAAEEAKKAGLLAPGELEPMLIRTLVQARAYHYLG
jgi:O-antigen ligase